jgi:hypothetical protein
MSMKWFMKVRVHEAIWNLTSKGHQWPNFGHSCFGQLGIR